jgi:hypothetical protein
VLDAPPWGDLERLRFRHASKFGWVTLLAPKMTRLRASVVVHGSPSSFRR